MHAKLKKLLSLKMPKLLIAAFSAAVCVVLIVCCLNIGLVPGSGFSKSNPYLVYIDLCLKGKQIHGFDINELKQIKIITSAIDDHVLNSIIPDRRIVLPDSRINITIQQDKNVAEFTQYHVFEIDGTPYMQSEETLLCSVMQDDIYSRLREIAFGYYQPYAMTIVSGDNTIKAAGHLLWNTDKVNGISADMIYFEPSQIAESVEYITLDPENDDMPPFTPFVKDREVYGKYKMYDQDFSEIPFSYSFENMKQGKYILELETSFEDSESSFGMQYFFGVIVP